MQKRILALGIAVLLIAAGGVAAAFLAKPSIGGDWEMIVNPEIADAEQAGSVYYTFSKPGSYGDGTYKTIFDGGVEEGRYKLSEQDGTPHIYLGTINLAYRIERPHFFDKATLTITYPEQTDEQTGKTTPAQAYVFVRGKAPDYEKMAYASFETDDTLLSSWVTKARTLSYYTQSLSYTETVTFQENGILTIRYESRDLALDRVMYYAYTAKDGTLTFRSVTAAEKEYVVRYALGEDGVLRFTQDETSASIFADAFFSDVPYYAS